jgi:hypothetical protein
MEFKVENLEFFDKDGYNLNLNWNDTKKIWEGNIFFPRVSVGLYENTTIYVVEYTGDEDDVYSYPRGEGNIVFQWDLGNSFVDEFFMFNFDDEYVIQDTSSLVHTPYDGPLCETLIINRFDKYNVPLLGSSRIIEQDDLLEIHVAFRSDEGSAETTYKRTLVMSYENGYTKRDIARITFFAETIEEDERLKIWNENLGYNLKPEDTIIFKHSDMHEYMPNFELLNEKRKELMLEGQNIYPFIGGYKAIINAIKFFGYDNLNIVEYWRNINKYDSNYGKIHSSYVYTFKDRKCFSTKRSPISLDTKNFKKLNFISLSYNINHPEEVDGEKYDKYGLPNTIEDFDKDKRDDFRLTIEEVLVKLFALKRKLNDEFMPGSTRITDVIGEGNYFGINLIGNNTQVSTVDYVESKGSVDFSVFPNKHIYITENEDFARFIAERKDLHVDETIEMLGDKTIDDLIEEYDGSDSDSDVSINEIDRDSLGSIINNLMINENDAICEFYKEYYNITYDNKYYDANLYGLRNIPDPRNVYGTSPNLTPDITICAKAILRGEFDENIDNTSIIEWKITHPNKGWEVTYTGDVKTFGNVFVQLPYLGNYDVEMSVWDLYNHCSKRYTKDAIVVEPYNIDIRGFYYDARPLPDELKYDLLIPKEYDISGEIYNYYVWNEITDGVNKYIVTINAEPSKISDILAEYLIEGDVIFDEYVINNNPANIIDTEKENWVSVETVVNDDSDISDNVLKITWMKNIADENGNNSISCGVERFGYVNKIEIDLFEDGDAYSPEWSKDVLYNVIKENVDKMYSGALREHIYVDNENTSMRNYNRLGEVNYEGPYYKYDVDTILYRIERGYKEYDHLNEEIINLEHGEHYKYVRYINSVVDIKPLTWVLLGLDQTRITGRIVNNDYPKWTLIMEGDPLESRGDIEIVTHTGLYFTYLFEDEGIYKIKLELKDINNNTYDIEKTIIIVDKDANYKTYHTLNDEYKKYLEMKNDRNLIYLN